MPIDHEKKIGDVLKGMMDNPKWKERLNETKIKEVWKSKMGTTINHYTKAITFRKGKLFISIESAPLKQELTYDRQKILDLMNHELGGDFVQSVTIR